MDITHGSRARRASAAYLADRTRVLRSMDRLVCVVSDVHSRAEASTILTGIGVVHVRSPVSAP